MYGVDGERDLTERILDHLHGYDGARPVRIGNAAYDQRQNDVWGAVLDSFYIHTRSRDRLDERIWPMLRRQVESALRHWREPDRGIWEVRGEPQALHLLEGHVLGGRRPGRPARPAPRGTRPGRVAGRPPPTRSTPTSAPTASTSAASSRSTTTPTPSTRRCCSSRCVALPAARRPQGPRHRPRHRRRADRRRSWSCATRTKETDDGLAGEEGTFTICSFWLVSALAEIGEHARARQLCEKLLSFASPLGLYAEEIDARSGRHLGNFPQAFTHLALINAVIHVIRAEQGRLITPRWPGTVPEP